MIAAAEIFDRFDRFAIRLAEDEDPGGAHAEPWVEVEVEVRLGDRVWSESDSCLSRAEAEQLADWFEGLGPGSPRLTFRESTLGFAFRDGRVHVALDLEFAPPRHEAAVPFDFSVPYDEQQARAFAAALRAQLVAAAEAEDVVPGGPLVPPRPPVRRG